MLESPPELVAGLRYSRPGAHRVYPSVDRVTILWTTKRTHIRTYNVAATKRECIVDRTCAWSLNPSSSRPLSFPSLGACPVVSCCRFYIGSWNGCLGVCESEHGYGFDSRAVESHAVWDTIGTALGTAGSFLQTDPCTTLLASTYTTKRPTRTSSRCGSLQHFCQCLEHQRHGLAYTAVNATLIARDRCIMEVLKVSVVAATDDSTVAIADTTIRGGACDRNPF